MTIDRVLDMGIERMTEPNHVTGIRAATSTRVTRSQRNVVPSLAPALAQPVRSCDVSQYLLRFFPVAAFITNAPRVKRHDVFSQESASCPS